MGVAIAGSTVGVHSGSQSGNEGVCLVIGLAKDESYCSSGGCYHSSEGNRPPGCPARPGRPASPGAFATGFGRDRRERVGREHKGCERDAGVSRTTASATGQP